MNELLTYLRTISWKDKQTGKSVKIDAGYFGIASYSIRCYGSILLCWYIGFKLEFFASCPTLEMFIIFIVLLALGLTYLWFHWDEFEDKANSQNIKKYRK